MLVLSRKVGEEIHIGENIRIKVIAKEGNRIKLGIEAPTEVSIRRMEIPPPEDSLQPLQPVEST